MDQDDHVKFETPQDEGHPLNSVKVDAAGVTTPTVIDSSPTWRNSQEKARHLDVDEQMTVPPTLKQRQ
jgi:hypothetical protein